MSVRVMPFGDEALLAEVSTASEVENLLHFAASLPSVSEALPGARTVLVKLDRGAASGLVAAALSGWNPSRTPVSVGPVPAQVQLPVHYGGADLREVATLTGLSVDEVIAAHSGAEYHVAFCGFAPGFAYLRGLPTILQLPRLASPRTRVPAGSVAIAAEFSAVYPRPSPGGWRLLGHTDVRLWDLAADPPTLLRPGVAVHFKPA